MKILPVSRILLVVLCLLHNICVVGGQMIDCGDDNNTCAFSNRNCLDPEGVCGECVNGFVEFRSVCVEIDSISFQEFLDTFEPLYTINSSVSERLELLRAAANFISDHNSQQPDFKLALNAFSADTEEEALQRTGYIHVEGTEDDLPLLETRASDPIAESVNWVESGAVTSVKDQGRCGCCWAVSMSGCIEGAAAVMSNFSYLQSMSFQQFISCNDRNSGCDGGNLVIANVYAAGNDFGGLSSLNNYPFSDEDGDTTNNCALDSGNISLAVTTSLGKIVDTFQSNNFFHERLERIKKAVSRQPISVVVKATCRTMDNYKSGVISDDGGCACDDVSCIDHAVLLVGYNDTTTTPYFLLKNSWGKGWGEDGYFRVSQENPRGQDSWGLFGVLGQGIVALEAVNVTNQELDKEQTVDDDLETIEIVFIVIGSVLGCFILSCCCAVVYGMVFKEKVY